MATRRSLGARWIALLAMALTSVVATASSANDDPAGGGALVWEVPPECPSRTAIDAGAPRF